MDIIVGERAPDHFVVATRPAAYGGVNWHYLHDHTAKSLRREYDAGTIELAQRVRDDGSFDLYRIPRRVKQERWYFSS